MTHQHFNSRRTPSSTRFASLALLIALFTSGGAALAQDASSSVPPDEPAGSCADVCGGFSEDGCYCDAVCTEAGDCCADFTEVCDVDDLPQPEPPVDLPPPPPPNLEGTCSDACGSQSADGCWCDSQCTELGDCCQDFNDICDADNLPEPEPPVFEPPPEFNPDGSCVDACGGFSEDGCWCDEICSEAGDCCQDFEPICSE